MMASRVLIETHDVSKVYGMGEISVTALNSVNLTIEEGEFVAVMGPSGSGKSTLMNILGCLDHPTHGRYVFGGEDISHLDRVELASIRSQRVGFVFQSYNLLARASALENVALPLVYDKVSRPTRREREVRAKEVLDSVGLGDRLDHLPSELSGGQQQRVAIARALVNDPLLVLADEPTGNLDSASGEEIMGLLHVLHSQGRTIAMVTHDPEIAAHTERTIHLLDGRVEAVVLNGVDGRGQDEAG